MIRAARTIFVNRFFHPDHSATAQLLSDLAFELAARGQAVTVITSPLIYDDPTAKLPRAETVRGVEIRRTATTRFGRETVLGRAADLASFYLSAGAELLRIAGRGDVIVAKTDPPLLSVIAAVAARMKRARLVNWLQDVYPEVARSLGGRSFAGTPWWLLEITRNQSLLAAHTNVVLGSRMADHLRRAGVPEAKITIIPNWSDDGAVAPTPHAQNPLRASWGLEGKFVVGYSGNLGRAHEYETLLGAARVLREDSRIVFLMVGGGHSMTALKAAAATEQLGAIVFKPYQPLDALSASLSAADVHWISLRPELEGLIVPSKAYGILAAGRPIIAVTDADGEIARLVRQHQCGVHVPPGDPVAFATTVRELAADPARVLALGARARTASLECYSRAKALSSWGAVLDTAARDGRRVGA